MNVARKFGPTSRDTRIILVTHTVANISIGVSYLLWSRTAAEGMLSLVFPSWLWPTMFILAGVLGFVGLWNRLVATYSFALAAIVTGVFGFASLLSVIVLGELTAITPTIFLLYIMFLKLVIAKMVRERDSVTERLQEVASAGVAALGVGQGNGTSTK